jgi:hypothetical protein
VERGAEVKPDTYAKTDGCHDCKHSILTYEYDGPDLLYCTFGDTESRPKCGSVAMQEQFGRDAEGNRRSIDDFGEECEAWDKWAEPRLVDEFGVCKMCEVTR